jgi:hypothetical protein
MGTEILTICSAVVGGAAISMAAVAFAGDTNTRVGTPIVFAQAGSTGGTIGKQGKSASGDEETKKPRASGGIDPSAGKSRRATGRPCDKIVGTWRWIRHGSDL